MFSPFQPSPRGCVGYPMHSLARPGTKTWRLDRRGLRCATGCHVSIARRQNASSSSIEAGRLSNTSVSHPVVLKLRGQPALQVDVRFVLIDMDALETTTAIARANCLHAGYECACAPGLVSPENIALAAPSSQIAKHSLRPSRIRRDPWHSP